ncbi:hypothetical protein BIFPSEUDO_04307 [Bifidobacterium pseudocatenulatum DSM 20438 = JCM 1200 = LMG 10505]|uniref:Uncharacterized protein n=1 Tax=Bifidobacterium pseudocatenulatum DSM 20438 = JCM 1200 = LMG 10505 TaxID=547043 RepID=C0BV64_BIFPS|nr:hypothetical protein BIFPSEUDO_04307 [Bifidobacterium pseudocatenulatum DSM 20438 = JCM 1200 = LMG 10505]
MHRIVTAYLRNPFLSSFLTFKSGTRLLFHKKAEIPPFSNNRKAIAIRGKMPYTLV